MKLARFPRVRLTHAPTPLEPMPLPRHMAQSFELLGFDAEGVADPFAAFEADL